MLFSQDHIGGSPEILFSRFAIFAIFLRHTRKVFCEAVNAEARYLVLSDIPLGICLGGSNIQANQFISKGRHWIISHGS